MPGPLTFTSAPLLRPPRRRGRPNVCTIPRMSNSVNVSLQDRVLRLERALAAAVTQERYTDAAVLRDTLAAVRDADPLLSCRAALAAAVGREDFAAAAALRDEVALLTERLARGDGGRVVDRLLVLRGRADPSTALRVATVSRAGAVPLGLVPAPGMNGAPPPRVFLQPTFSPSADYVSFTEVSFRVENVHGMRAVSIADSESRVIIMNAFDGTIVKAVSVAKPPFFYAWSPCGKTLTMLSNDPTSGTPKVAMSAIQVVAPAGGGSGDLDAVHGPLASAHPLLYDFCPRDSTRVVAHLGNLNSVCIVPVASPAGGKRPLSNCAGSFGTPQWHPLAGSDGREVVLFVEVEAPLSKDGDESSTAKSSKPEGIKGMRSIFSPVVKKPEEKAERDVGDVPDKDGAKGSALDSLLGSGGSILENILRRGARKLGFTENSNESQKDAKQDEAAKEAESTSEGTTDVSSVGSSSSPESEFGQRIAGGLRRLLPERPPPLRGQDQWNEKPEATEKKVKNRLVMCDANDPTIRRVLCRFSGVMAFKLSPDGKKLVTMITDPATGQDELTLCTGDFSPDSVDYEENAHGRGREKRQSNADIILSTPYTRVLAFFWSPDSRRLLFLSSIRGSRAGAAQWATFDTETNRVVRYQKFVLSGIYIHCLNFFDQFSSSMTPWSPDSSAFCYPGRALTDSEKERDESTSSSTPSSPLLASLLLSRENSGDSKLFSAWVQRVPDTSRGKTPPQDPTAVMENVEYASWSPC